MKTITDDIDADRDRIAKLPAWAQGYISTLYLKLGEARAQVAELSAGPENSNVRVPEHEGPDRLLGRDTRVSFDLEDGGAIEVRHLDGNTVTIRGVGGTGSSLHITPSASNTARVRLGAY